MAGARALLSSRCGRLAAGMLALAVQALLMALQL
jgi:hypothetical protein